MFLCFCLGSDFARSFGVGARNFEEPLYNGKVGVADRDMSQQTWDGRDSSVGRRRNMMTERLYHVARWHTTIVPRRLLPLATWISAPHVDSRCPFSAQEAVIHSLSGTTSEEIAGSLLLTSTDGC